MAELRVLVDVNILLDVLANRRPFYDDAAQVWAVVEGKIVEGLIAAHTVTTIYYLVRRHHSRQAACNAIADMLRVFSVAELDQDVLLQALSLGWDDFEDAVQAISAAKRQCHYLVTRDEGMANSPVTPISPADFNRLVRSSSDEGGSSN